MANNAATNGDKAYCSQTGVSTTGAVDSANKSIAFLWEAKVLLLLDDFGVCDPAVTDGVR